MASLPACWITIDQLGNSALVAPVYDRRICNGAWISAVADRRLQGIDGRGDILHRDVICDACAAEL